MSTTTDLLAEALAGGNEMLKRTLTDFSEADLLVRPVAGANHAAWQLGHVICSEVRMTQACGAPGADLPAGFAEKFTKDTAKLDDPKTFPTKQQFLDLAAKVRAATVAWARTLSDADLAKPAPEPMRAFCPTVGHLLALANGHTMMHLGQIQVIRRKLGKPVLF